MDRDTAIRKVKACLARSKSSNANEAATALRQARALMDKFGIYQHDPALSDIETTETKTGRRCTQAGRVPLYLVELGRLIELSFGVKTYYTIGSGHLGLAIVGIAPSAQIACYAYDTLMRQLMRDRKAFWKSTRGKRSNRIQRADYFCYAWTRAVRRQVQAFTGDQPVIDQRITEYTGKLNITAETCGTSRGGKSSNCRDDDWVRGVSAGMNANLHRGVDGEKQRMIE